MTKRVRALLAGVAIVAAGLFAASQASAVVIVNQIDNAGAGGGNVFTPLHPLGSILNTPFYETLGSQPGNVCTDPGNCNYDFTFILSGLAAGATTLIQIQAASQVAPGTRVPLDYDLFSGVPGPTPLPTSSPDFLAASAPTGGLAQIINATLGDGSYFVQITAAQVLSDGEVGSGSLTQFTATPEPASWALMLVGIGGIGAALRRRARTAAIAA